MLSANKDSFISSFPTYIYFFFFCLLLNLLEPPVNVELKWEEADTLALFLITERKNLFSHHYVWYGCKLSTLLFIKLRKFLSILNSLRSLIMTGCWILTSALAESFDYWSNTFSSLSCDQMIFFPLTYWCTNCIIWFLNVELAWILRINLSVVVYIYIYIGFDLMIFCWQVLHLCSWDTLVCSFPFL